MAHQRNQSQPVDRSAFAGYRFPPGNVNLIWPHVLKFSGLGWYLRYGLSYRNVEELLTERGIEVDHVTIHRWGRSSTCTSPADATSTTVSNVIMAD